MNFSHTLTLFTFSFLNFCTNAFAQNACAKFYTESELLKTLEYPISLDIGKISSECSFGDRAEERLVQIISRNLTKTDSARIIKWTGEKVVPSTSSILECINSNAPDTLCNCILKAQFSESLLKTTGFPYFKIHPSLIYALGIYEKREMVPFLRKVISFPDSIYPKLSVLLTLARLGDKNAEQKVFSTLRPNETLQDEAWFEDFGQKLHQYLYVGSQQSYYEFIHWLNDHRTYNVTFHGSNRALVSYYIVSLLSYLIKNPDFPHNSSGKNEVYTIEEQKRRVQECRSWLISNVGKYIISKEKVVFSVLPQR